MNAIIVNLILPFLMLNFNIKKCKESSYDNSSKNIEQRIQSDSTMLDSLKNIQKKEYIGQEVGLFLNNKVVSKYKQYQFVDRKPGRLTHLLLKYSPTLYVEIAVNKYKYIKPFDENRKWNFELYKKETISEISIISNNQYVETVK